jgi:hypothetical protein
MFSEEGLWECNAFRMFLENHDGESWNTMMQALSRFYKKSINDTEFEYLPNAVARVSQLCLKYFSRYWAGFAQDRQFCFENKLEICAHVATQIALLALQEFEIGNFF